jgi:4,5-DOPA dioxygenase extradiol
MGFPPELYAMRYPAPGAPDLAHEIAVLAGATCDDAWGFDHASWAVLCHMYPDADVPLLELSLDAGASPVEHFEIGCRLAALRDRGVLVIGSGNVVHNLRAVRRTIGAEPYPWALAVPTNEHYLPLLYAVALRREGDALAFTHTGIDLGSVSMRCVRIG